MEIRMGKGIQAMTNSKFIYNNEGICAVGIMAFLEIMEELSYSKVMLIAPFIFNAKLVKFLGTNSKVRSFEELRVKQVSSVTRFSKMYTNFLPVTINSLVILSEMGFIKLEGETIKLKTPLLQHKNISKFGKRANNIIKVAPKLVNLLNEDEEKLYLQLGVML
jgi:hypothetical protein